MSGKVKLYKNPERNRPTNLKPYIPQYQLRGVEPEEYNSPLSASYRIEAATKPQPLPKTNPRAPRPMMRQPYAEAVPSPVGRGKGPLPNVGNNMEQTWSSVDGEIIDDLSEDIDIDQEMLDNNDFVSDAALGISSESDSEEPLEVEDAPVQPPAKTFLTENELQDALHEEYLSAVLKNLNEGEFVLLVDGKAICSGDLDAVQEQTRALVFGEHPLCGGDPMPIEDITVLRRVKFKIGLFLE
jgi:hypothetical protein